MVRSTIKRTYLVELTGAGLPNDSWRNCYHGGGNPSRRTFGTNFSLSFKANLDDMRLPFLRPDQ